MYKVKITVLSVELKPTLIERYGYPKMEKCPKHQEGETFITDFRKPNALCEDA